MPRRSQVARRPSVLSSSPRTGEDIPALRTPWMGRRGLRWRSPAATSMKPPTGSKSCRAGRPDRASKNLGWIITRSTPQSYNRRKQSLNTCRPSLLQLPRCTLTESSPVQTPCSRRRWRPGLSGTPNGLFPPIGAQKGVGRNSRHFKPNELNPGGGITAGFIPWHQGRCSSRQTATPTRPHSNPKGRYPAYPRIGISKIWKRST